MKHINKYLIESILDDDENLDTRDVGIQLEFCGENKEYTKRQFKQCKTIDENQLKEYLGRMLDSVIDDIKCDISHIYYRMTYCAADWGKDEHGNTIEHLKVNVVDTNLPNVPIFTVYYDSNERNKENAFTIWRASGITSPKLFNKFEQEIIKINSELA